MSHRDLVRAVIGGKAKVVKEILLSAAEGIVNHREPKRKLCLIHFAVIEDHMHILKLLIRFNANTKALTTGRRTLLHIACDLGRAEMVKMFIEMGFDLEAKDKWNKMPSQLAREKGYGDIGLMLEILIRRKYLPPIPTHYIEPLYFTPDGRRKRYGNKVDDHPDEAKEEEKALVPVPTLPEIKRTILGLRQLAHKRDEGFEYWNSFEFNAVISLIEAWSRENAELRLIGRNYYKMGDVGCHAVCAALKLGPTVEGLKRLDIQRHDISKVGVDMICDVLRQTKSLKHLVLDKSDLDDEMALKLISVMDEDNATIRTLSLEVNQLTDVFLKGLVTKFANNETLRSLLLAGNDFTAEGGASLWRWVFGPTDEEKAKMEEDARERAARAKEEGKEDWMDEAEKAKAKKKKNNLYVNDDIRSYVKLRSISLGSIRMKEEALTSLARWIPQHKSLEEVILYGKESSPSAVAIIANALEMEQPKKAKISSTKRLKPNCPLLARVRLLNIVNTLSLPMLTKPLKANRVMRKLDLTLCHLGMDGGQIIADLLRVNRGLRELTLDTCKLGATGIEFLSTALVKNKSLRYLYIPNNSIGNVGTSYLCKALESNRGLRKLNLDTNKIKEEGCIALAEMLKKNKTLEELSLEYNKINEEGEAILHTSAASSPTLNRINIYGWLDLEAVRSANEAAARPEESEQTTTTEKADAGAEKANDDTNKGVDNSVKMSV